MLSARSLLVRTAATIAISLSLFVFISLGAAAYFVAIPIAKRSADDLAALMFFSAQTWQASSTDDRSSLRLKLLQEHDLIVAVQTPALEEQQFSMPYFFFMRDALSRRAGEEMVILKGLAGKRLWVDIPVEDGFVRLGFDPDRMTARPPTVLMLVIGGGILLTLFTSFIVVGRIIRPLDRLYSAVRQVGQGHKPRPLAEEGPEELAILARAFNRMSLEVQTLLENRTVMVAGISHDLRTPLTRLGLAVEMLSEDSDPQLVADIRRDLKDMENLIQQFMELAQGLDDEREEDLDLSEMLRTQQANLERQGFKLVLSGVDHCHFRGNPLALKRILVNLLDNAAYYGDGNPVEVELQRNNRFICIRIRDRGPGIPETQREAVFRPFYRLDAARSVRTGGSGLGLAIASQLANRNGWKIGLMPRDGGGTEAKLELPVEDDL